MKHKIDLRIEFKAKLHDDLPSLKLYNPDPFRWFPHAPTPSLSLSLSVINHTVSSIVLFSELIINQSPCLGFSDQQNQNQSSSYLPILLFLQPSLPSLAPPDPSLPLPPPQNISTAPPPLFPSVPILSFLQFFN